MSGDPAQSRLWQGADIYVAFGADQAALDLIARPSTFNIDDPESDWSSAWDLLGLLDPDAGIVETREQDENPHFAWGGVQYRVSRGNFQTLQKFTAIEVENPTVDRLRWPGSTANEIVVPTNRVENVLVGIEKRDNELGVIRRMVTKYHAQATVDGDVEVKDSTPSKVPFKAAIFPTPSYPFVLWDRWSTADEEMSD